MKKNMKKWLGVSIFVFGLYVCSATHAQATEYYVDKTSKGGPCLDTNPGTIVKPWCTIQKATNTLVAGDTVYVRDGVYRESSSIITSGSEGKPITFKAYPNEHPIVDGTGMTLSPGSGSLFTVASGVKYIIIDGFEIRNSSSYLIFGKGANDHSIVRNCLIHGNEHKDAQGNPICWPSADRGWDAVFFKDSQYITYENNEVYAGGHNGLSCTACSNSTFKNNNVHDVLCHNGLNLFPNPTANPQPFYSGNQIIFNRVDNCKNGMLFRYQQNMLIANNVFSNSGSGNSGIYIQTNPDTSNVNYDANVKIYNNVFHNLGVAGIDNMNANYLDIKNNIFSNIAGKALRLSVKNGDTINNNLYYDTGLSFNWGGITYSSLSAFKSASGQDSASFDAKDPLFVNPANNDFHLQATSPAKDKGVNVGLLKDPDGTSIPQGSLPDIGMYEYKVPTPPAPVVCKLTAASWNQTQATEGDVVQLNVQAENCTGKNFNYTIKEDDGLLVDDLIASFVSASLNPTWVTINLGDQIGDPEYYFEVYEIGNPNNALVSSKTAELIVAKNTCLDTDSDSYDTCSNGEPRDDGRIKDCNDTNASINPGIVEVCGDGIDNNCDGKDNICPDTISPQIISFDANKSSTETGKVNANWNVTDNIGLTRTELWRTTNNNGSPNESNWGQVSAENTITGSSVTSNFVDTPSTGIWWYKLKAVDQSGNQSEKIDAEPVEIVVQTCLPKPSSYSCEREDPATLCSKGFPKVTQIASCYEIKTDSCGEMFKQLLPTNEKCGKTCQDKILNCGSNRWREVAP